MRHDGLDVEGMSVVDRLREFGGTPVLIVHGSIDPLAPVVRAHELFGSGEGTEAPPHYRRRGAWPLWGPTSPIGYAAALTSFLPGGPGPSRVTACAVSKISDAFTLQDAAPFKFRHKLQGHPALELEDAQAAGADAARGPALLFERADETRRRLREQHHRSPQRVAHRRHHREHPHLERLHHGALAECCRRFVISTATWWPTWATRCGRAGSGPRRPSRCCTSSSARPTR